MKIVFLILFLFFPFTRAPAAEPKKEETLEPVVVTATRTETPLRDVTTSITVITEDDIRNKQAETVVDVLRYVPGLDVVQKGSRGTTTSVFIRGSESDQVLVLVDGVQVNSTTLGSFDFAHLTTESIERIEVLRGSGGTLYGSQAIGGVIQIFTKSGKGKPVLTASVEGGNGYTNRQALTLGGKVKKLGFFLSGSHTSTDGFRPINDDYKNIGTSVRMDLETTENTLLRGIFQFRKSDVGLANNNNFFPALIPDPNARSELTSYLVKFDWEHKPLPGWDYRLSGSMFKQNQFSSDDPDPSFCDPNDANDPNRFFCDTETRSRFRPRTLTGGIQTNYQWGERGTSTFGFEYKDAQAKTVDFDENQRNIATYFQQQLSFLDDRLILVGGTRLDDNDPFGTEWSPSFSAAYLFKETGTKIKGGYAEGFRAPTLNQLFFPPGFGCAAFGNPGLGPEKSWEFNAGTEQALFRDRVKLGVTYFHREVKDLVGTGPTPDPTDFASCVRAENVGQARFDGVELVANIKLLSTVSIGANYTYLDWDTEDGRLDGRPRHKGNISVNYQRNGFNINLAINIVGERDDNDPATRTDIKNPGYVKMDLASYYILPWKIPGVKNLRLYGKIENLLDQDYEEAAGFPSRPINFLFGIGSAFGKNEEEKNEKR